MKVVYLKLKRCNFQINYSHISTGVPQQNENRASVCFIACFKLGKSIQVDGSLFEETKDCLLCLGNLIGDEKHYIFYCTIDKLVDIRKDFVKELHESNLNSSTILISSFRAILAKP